MSSKPRAFVATLLSLAAQVSAECFAATKAEADNADGVVATLNGDYISGKYGSRQTTEVESLTSGLEWTVFDQTTLSASIPFLIQHAPRGTVGGGSHGAAHRGNNRGTRTQEVTTTGIGDVTIGIDQGFLTQSDQNPIDVGAFSEVKFGTADVSKGLGSGQNDYTFGGRLGRAWNRYYVSCEAGYVVVGNPGQVTANGVSTTLNYRNAAFGAIGATYDINDNVTLGTIFNATESYERGLPATLTIGANAIYHVSNRLSLKGAALTGLNNNSPKVGVSVSARFDL